LIEIILRETVLASNRFALEKVQDPGTSEAASFKVQDGQKTLDQTSFFPDVTVRNGERDSFRVLRGSVEDSLNIRRVALYVRHHDQYVLRHEGPIFFKHEEKLIPENLDFPHGAVTGMNLDGGILLGNPLLSLPFLKPQDVRLDGGQEVVFSRRFIG